MKTLVAAMLLMLVAGSARAAEPDALRRAVYRSPASAVATLPAPMRTEAPALPRGVVRTSIDHRFDRDVEGALGYLCGRKPDEIAAGAAGARGVDHDGRFLGVQLKMSLR
jgi:hypothetical protein